MGSTGEIQRAFERLAARAGYEIRPDQVQLAHFLSDLIEGGGNGAVEAPTGLGKSLAALVPALVQARQGRRVVIATYTNVLAEQYWRKDLPLALSLLDPEPDAPRVEYLVGRQRYACLLAMTEHLPQHVDTFRALAELGVESEFRRLIRGRPRELDALWSSVATPPVCSGRECAFFSDCFFYGARRRAESAQVLITNHSVVLLDALQAIQSSEGSGFLGRYDFVILDEAHDFLGAALAGLEFEISEPKVSGWQGVVGRLHKDLLAVASAGNLGVKWDQLCDGFRGQLEALKGDLRSLNLATPRPGILAASPPDLNESPGVKSIATDATRADALTRALADACQTFTEQASEMMGEMELGRLAESARAYLTYLREVGVMAGNFLQPSGVSVSSVQKVWDAAALRTDPVDVAQPLRELIWDRKPYALLSATLALDGNFEFLRRTLGCEPTFAEVLPSPFDHATQAALYLPRGGALPDPTVARKEGTEDAYFAAMARELDGIIRAMSGRTLALFHSRREMEAVFERMNLPDDLRVLIQGRSNASHVGDRFKAEPRASLFALRSFWTGFDAPGDTLSCVALVRVPFEVPVEPPAVTRMAYLRGLGHDPFGVWTLPLAKMLVRQGSGRLIRREGDRGIIALLDPRLRTKRYGEEILANLPAQMRTFDDILEAVAWVGLG